MYVDHAPLKPLRRHIDYLQNCLFRLVSGLTARTGLFVVVTVAAPNASHSRVVCDFIFKSDATLQGAVTFHIFQKLHSLAVRSLTSVKSHPFARVRPYFRGLEKRVSLLSRSLAFLNTRLP